MGQEPCAPEVGNGAAVVKPPSALFRRIFFRQIESKPSRSNPTVQIEGYPFDRNFCQYALTIILVLTRSRKRVYKFRSLFLKANFGSVLLKYVFSYLQFCHSTCFNHKISVLTPI